MLMSCCENTQNGGWVWSHSLFLCKNGQCYIAYYKILCMMCFRIEHFEMLFW